MTKSHTSSFTGASSLTGRPARQRAVAVLIGTMLLSFILGSVHAFSVLLPAMETTFETSRTAASLTYSLALVALALAVLLGHRFYASVAPASYALGTGCLAALGCLVAGFGDSVMMVWLGYSLLFGAANGMGYGYALQFSAQAMPERRGFAMGAITAAYALGAVVFPVPLSLALKAGGWPAALVLLAASLLVVSAISALLLARAGMRYLGRRAETAAAVRVSWRVIALLWLAYGAAVTAGLMTIGHATAIAAAAGADEGWRVAAPIVIAVANMVGSLLCGALLDRLAGRLILSVLTLLAATLLVAMALLPQVAITMLGLAVIGFTYGGTIAVYPAYISKSFGAALGTIVYGRVFTAWAVAGLVGAGSAGVLFDAHQSYQVALLVAAAIALFSMLALHLSVRRWAVGAKGS